MFRIAWLLTHEALIRDEVPLLQRLGYEVFVPQVISQGEFKTYLTLCNKDSTLPPEDLQILARVNFYQPLTPDVTRLLRKNFVACLCDINVLEATKLPTIFPGKVFLRVFGREYPHRYGREIPCLGCPNLIIGAAYSEIIAWEIPEVQSRMVHLPLGLSDSFWHTYHNIWNPQDNSIAFVCSLFQTNSYYGEIYRNFVKDFDTLPYKIYGNNPSDLPHHIVGNLPNTEEYLRKLSTHTALYYHSKEPRHLHYHPLEAMVMGIPVVFQREGILGSYAQKVPIMCTGSCETTQEAYQKLQRLLNGDTNLAEEIRTTQRPLIGLFTLEKCVPKWEEHFVRSLKK